MALVMMLTCDSKIKLTISPSVAVSLANTTKYSSCLYKLWTACPARGGIATKLIRTIVSRSLSILWSEVLNFDELSTSYFSFCSRLKSARMNRRKIIPKNYITPFEVNMLWYLYLLKLVIIISINIKLKPIYAFKDLF